MSIWTYAQQAKEIRLLIKSEGGCFFCRDKMIMLHNDGAQSKEKFSVTSSDVQIFACARCGWWCAHESTTRAMYRLIGHTMEQKIKGAAGSLLELDLSDQTMPIQAIRDHLMVSPILIERVHPDRFEKVVADVYKDLGFHTIATASSGDDGIDVILVEKGGKRIGIQVKRYKNKIQVEQIRSLAGALVFNDMTQGIFITTSDFTTGAPRTVQKYKRRGFQIKLINGEKFLRNLEIAQRKMFRNRKEFDQEEILKRMKVIDSSYSLDVLDDDPFGVRPRYM